MGALCSKADGAGKGRSFFSLEQDRDSSPGGVAIRLCASKIHGKRAHHGVAGRQNVRRHFVYRMIGGRDH